jgi:LPS-assembly protein
MTCALRPASPRRAAAFCGALTLAVAALLGPELQVAPAQAQLLNFPARPKPPVREPRSGDEQMLVQANEIHYDYTNYRVSAVGNVQIYYGGRRLEADKVVYNQNTKRLRAEGNVRLTELDGQVSYGEIMELDDQYRDGFVDSLRLDAPEQTRFAAQRADRSDGNYTVFHNGVYTACEACKDDPKRPPLWQVKAARIIHDQNEKMVYFETAQLEFFGYPVAYFPYMSTPDPTVKRKTGVLMPSMATTSKYGVAVEIPYFWALAPDYDLTLTPRYTSKQGWLGQAEWRQRMANGSYFVRGAGIFQEDKEFFNRPGNPTPGYRDSRGGLESSGQFRLADQWVWGWDAVLLSDRTFLLDYDLVKQRATNDVFLTGASEGVSQLYVQGAGRRSFFDVRSIYYLAYTEADEQRMIPVIHPVLDYNYTFDKPVLGGELSYRVNFTSLTRQAVSLDPITQDALAFGRCAPTSADPAAKIPANCLLRGIPGTYSRFSAETNWRRSYIDSFGQIFTPFASLRADAASISIKNDLAVSNFITTGDSTVLRAMPTVGMEYRYPFISVNSWGTQTLEPIAQLIVRPNETLAGKLPNEDAQSLVFDDANLFRIDKFSGWDRAEGGGRLNAGVQYTAQFAGAGFFNALIGQSYHLFGTNSFAIADLTHTGLNSGLETSRSDYVARASYSPSANYQINTRYRFDESTFEVRRFEVEARVNFNRWSGTLAYGNYDAQPELGFLRRREGMYGNMTFKLTPNWTVLGGLLYDLDESKITAHQIGGGYVDDCFIIAMNYITSYTYSSNPTADHRVMLQMTLRTIGGSSVSQAVGSPSGSGGLFGAGL